MPSSTLPVRCAVPAVLTREGELVPIHELPAVTASEAAFRLPQIQRIIREARRLEGYLMTVISEEIASVEGRTELRLDDTVYELKPDYEWVVENPLALWNVLCAARDRGDITQAELGDACRLQESVRANHSRLNALAKRLPDIDRYRTRTQTVPKLRTRSEK